MSDMSEVFSRREKLGGIGPATRRRIEANEAERAALAALFGLPAIAALSGEFELAHEQDGVIAASLKLRARVTQICVVTLEPFEARVAEDAKLRFVPAAKVREGEEHVLDAETLEGPDEIVFTGQVIDLGAVLAEQLALALDPYPRKPGAVLPETAADEAAHPFAALRGRRQ
jgi:uncharacterized metal-binding protein YceD (DUF177 family)